MEVEFVPGQKIYAQADLELRLRPAQVGAQPAFATAGLPTGEQVAERFQALAQFVAKRTEQVIRQYQELGAAIRPSKVALEFAIGIEGSVGFPFLANSKGDSEHHYYR